MRGWERSNSIDLERGKELILYIKNKIKAHKAPKPEVFKASSFDMEGVDGMFGVDMNGKAGILGKETLIANRILCKDPKTPWYEKLYLREPVVFRDIVKNIDAKDLINRYKLPLPEDTANFWDIWLYFFNGVTQKKAAGEVWYSWIKVDGGEITLDYEYTPIAFHAKDISQDILIKNYNCHGRCFLRVPAFNINNLKSGMVKAEFNKIAYKYKKLIKAKNNEIVFIKNGLEGTSSVLCDFIKL